MPTQLQRPCSECHGCRVGRITPTPRHRPSCRASAGRGVGNWINRDPIQEWGGINLYTFSANAPSDALDAFGRQAAGKPPLVGKIPLLRDPLGMLDPGTANGAVTSCRLVSRTSPIRGAPERWVQRPTRGYTLVWEDLSPNGQSACIWRCNSISTEFPGRPWTQVTFACPGEPCRSPVDGSPWQPEQPNPYDDFFRFPEIWE